MSMAISQSASEKMAEQLVVPLQNCLLGLQPPHSSLATTPDQSPNLSFSFDSPQEEQEPITPPGSPQFEKFPETQLSSDKTILFNVGNYQVFSRLGLGAFSEVYLGKLPNSSEYVALKLIPRDSYSQETFEREVNILRQLHHPNIVQFKDSLITEQYYVIVQEYIPDGEFLKLVASHQKEFTVLDIIALFRQCVDAVKYLHEKGFAHRDIKLENFLLDKRYTQVPIVKLCDFGFAMSCENVTTIEVDKVGSDEYLAPELIVHSDRGYDIRSCDIWALGIILYTLLVGYLPFSYDSPQTRTRMFHRIASGDLKFNQSYNPLLQQTVRGLLKTNPRQRSSLDDVLSNLFI